MATNRLISLEEPENPLGAYLKSCRAKRDPAVFGFSSKRRRTPGLRREEVAQLANVSATWYTWLEQGRGGTPSVDVLEGIAQALALTSVEREYLFLVAQGRPPETRKEPGVVSSHLQRMLDAMILSPAYIKNAQWDILAWNKAAEKVLQNCNRLPVGRRNILDGIFCDPESKARIPNWPEFARFCVAAFRADCARVGISERSNPVVQRLTLQSPEFRAIWEDNEVNHFGEGRKVIHHPNVGEIRMEYSAFLVDGQPDLSLVVFTPVADEDEERVRSLVSQ